MLLPDLGTYHTYLFFAGFAAFGSRRLCGLPFKKPSKSVSFYRRQNGNEVLEIVAHPEHGLPFRMDVEVLIWTCILAKQAMLRDGKRVCFRSHRVRIFCTAKIVSRKARDRHSIEVLRIYHAAQGRL